MGLVLGAGLALCGAPQRAVAQEDTVAQARLLAAKGQQEFERGNYRAAMEAFEKAYATKPHFLMHCNIARCHEMLEQHAAAAKRYQRCLEEGGDRSPMASQIRQSMEQAAAKAKPKEPEPPPPSRPGAPPPLPRRPLFGRLGMGAAIELHEAPAQLTLDGRFGVHFNGTSAGPALGLDLRLGLTNEVVTLLAGPRFQWDIMLVRSMGLMLSPSAQAGYVYMTKSFAHGGRQGGHGVGGQLGLELQLLLAQRTLLFFQPVGVELLATHNGDWHLGLRYGLVFGGGAVF